MIDLASHGPLAIMAAVAISSLLAGTVRSIKNNLVRSATGSGALVCAALFGWLESFLWFAAGMSMIAAAPHPSMIVLVVLLFASFVVAGRLRLREEERSLNRWIPTTLENEAPLVPFLDRLANGYRSRIGRSVKSCAIRLRRGETFADAVRRANMPLRADTVAMIAVDKTPARSAEVLSDVNWDRQYVVDSVGSDSLRTKSLAYQQFAYVAVMVLLAWLIGWGLRKMTLPTIINIMSEFSSGDRVYRDVLETVAWIGDLVALLFVVWLISAFVLQWSTTLLPWVPWFGRTAVVKWRCEILDALGRQIRSGQSEGEVLALMARSTRVRWIRRQCLLILRCIEKGMPLSTAMRRAKLVSKQESDWLKCAQNNDNLPISMQRLRMNLRRRDQYRWRLRMAWFVPLATVLVGGYVLVHALVLFNCFVSIIGRVA